MGLWIGLAILLVIFAVIVRRGLQMKALAHDGVPGQAEIVLKHRRRTSPGHQTAGYLKYQFDAPLGQTLTNRIAVSEEVFSKYEVGDPIDIVYLPDKPAVNGARYMVNLSRKALKLPPL
jgi:hypothetical protein